jgi:hypothetical protein
VKERVELVHMVWVYLPVNTSHPGKGHCGKRDPLNGQDIQLAFLLNGLVLWKMRGRRRIVDFLLLFV